MIVVDASVVVELLMATQPHADEALRLIAEHGGDMHTPHLVDAEVGQVVRRYLLRGELTVERADTLVEHLGQLRLVRYPHTPFLQDALRLARNLTLYDALYVSLARVLRAPLITGDAAVAEVAGRVGVSAIATHARG